MPSPYKTCISSFQSTLSVRRATPPIPDYFHQTNQISIHALRKESDISGVPTWNSTARFQSTLSVRRATSLCPECVKAKEISIHALRKESDRA